MLEKLVAGDAFAAVHLGYVFFDALIQRRLADLKPLLLGFKKVQRVGDKLIGRSVMSQLNLALDALFGCGVQRAAALRPHLIHFAYEWGTRQGGKNTTRPPQSRNIFGNV